MNDPTDIGQATQLAKLQRREPEAWHAFVTEFGPVIYRYFRNMTPLNQQPEDLANEAMRALYEGFPAFRGESSLRTWVHRVCRNILVDHIRGWTRWKQVLQQPWQWLAPQPTASPEDLLSAKDQYEQIQQALRELPLKYRDVLTLRFLQECSILETADILSISTTLVKSRTRQAKELLRTRLHQHQQAPLALALDREAKK